MTNATYYHAGCPVCVSAENALLDKLDRSKIDLEVVHLGEASGRVAEAESKGVQSVPALVLNDEALGEQVLHLNFGAALADLKQ